MYGVLHDEFGSIIAGRKTKQRHGGKRPPLQTRFCHPSKKPGRQNNYAHPQITSANKLYKAEKKNFTEMYWVMAVNVGRGGIGGELEGAGFERAGFEQIN